MCSFQEVSGGGEGRLFSQSQHLLAHTHSAVAHRGPQELMTPARPRDSGVCVSATTPCRTPATHSPPVTNFHLDMPQLESSISLPKQEGEDGRNKNNQGSIFSKSSALSSQLCVCVHSTLSSWKVTKQNAASAHANSTRAGKRKEETQPGRRRTRTQRLRAVMPPS